MNRQQKADLQLLMVTAFWGVSYLLMDICLTDLQPMTLNAFRFLVAFGVLGIFLRKDLKRISRRTLRYSFWIGLCLSMVYICCTYGVLYTSLSNAGFICALPVVTTPLLEFIVFRKKPGRQFLLCLIMCTIGLGLMTLNAEFKPALGDVICLGTAVFYGCDLIITDRAVHDPEVSPIQLGVCQLGVVGVVMLVLALILEEPHLPTTPGIWASALFLGVFCSGVAFVVQAVAQQYTTASHVGLIFTMEPLFAFVVAFLFAHERLAARGYVGVALMMASLVLVEMPMKEKKKQGNG